MQLIVPTPFSTEFLERIKPYPVRYIYGSLPQDPSLRSRAWLPVIDEKTMEHHVQQAREQRVGFLYALNAACWGNREFTAQGQRNLVSRLGWLEAIGVEGVIVANPYIIEFIKRRFPNLKVYVSTISNMDTVDKARFYRELDCEGLHLPEYVNRDFRLLRSLAQDHHENLTLTVNLCCLLHCPIRDYHANFISHAGESLDRGCYVDYSLMKCTQMKLMNPVEIIKATWIRPEDLAIYEVMGINTFKISGRIEEMPWLLRVIEAYSTRSYNGALNDLLSGLEDIEPFGAFPFKLDNTSLKGFLQFFQQKDCSSGCGDCGYCGEWVERSIMPEGNCQEYQKKMEHSLRTIASGCFRAPYLKE